MKLKNCSLRIEICSDWLYARILSATNRGINPLATVFAVGFSRQSCMGGGFAGTMISRRGAEFFLRWL